MKVPVNLAPPGLTLHEDAFYEYFQPYRHPSTSLDCFGGIGMETFGKDRDLAYSLDSNYVWTVVDGTDDGKLYICTGLHVVNRVAYLVATKPHYALPIGFRCDGRPSSLTQLGLKRQTNRLRRYVAAHRANFVSPR